MLPQVTASHISSNKKRSRDDEGMEGRGRKTTQDVGFQTDDLFHRSVGRTSAEMIPFPMPEQWYPSNLRCPPSYPMYPPSYPMYPPPQVSRPPPPPPLQVSRPMMQWLPSPPQVSRPMMQWTPPPPQVSRPMMQFPFGQFSLPFDSQMGPSQRFSLPVGQGLGSTVTMPSPAVFSESMGLGTSPAVFSHSMGHSMGLGPTSGSSKPDLMTPLPKPTPNVVEPTLWTRNRQVSPPQGSTTPDRWIIGSRPSNIPTPPRDKRTPPPRCPPYPKGSDLKALKEWNRECRKVDTLAAKDPLYNLPFLEQNNFPLLEKPKDLVRKSDKAVVHKVAKSLVSVSSVDQDGVVMLQCCGVIIGTFKENEPAIILTTSDVICDDSGNLCSHKVLVRLPDNKEFDGNILYFDPYYQIAFLGISGKLLVGPSFESTLEFGDEVFVVSRNKKSSLMANKGEVLCLETSYLNRNFFKYLSCGLPKGCVDGAVVDKNGNISGIAFIVGIPSPAIIPSSIIVKCIEMYKKFGCIARPEHGISLRTMDSLDIATKEGIMVEHKIDSGYIVDEVLDESDADKFDIRMGDIIVSFDGMNSQSLLELELYLLSIGCEFLEKNLDSNSKVIFKLQVYDPLGHCSRMIRLPVGFSSSRAGTTDGRNNEAEAPSLLVDQCRF